MDVQEENKPQYDLDHVSAFTGNSVNETGSNIKCQTSRTHTFPVSNHFRKYKRIFHSDNSITWFGICVQSSHVIINTQEWQFLSAEINCVWK